MNLFNISNEEEKVGDAFSKLFNQRYIKNNANQKTKIDGKINNIFIELQNLKYKKSLEEKNIIIDTVSIFHFKDEYNKRSRISLKDKDIIIEKYGKLYSLKDEDIYLIYIKREDLEDLNLFHKYKDYIQNKGYIFLPINMKKLKNILNKSTFTHIVNNKKLNKLNDNWESAFCSISLKEDILYSPKELSNLFYNNNPFKLNN